MSVDWTELSQDEADRLAIAQEHRLRGARWPQLGPTRGQILGRSAAWIGVWAVTGYVLWQAMPS